MHVHPEFGIVEFIDPKAVELRAPNKVELEEGNRVAKVVGTSLHNMSMPLIRYDTGDLVEISDHESTCPCGRRTQLVRRIIGREEDVVVTTDGSIVTALYVVFNDFPEIEMGQIIQSAADELRIKIAKSPFCREFRERELEGKLRAFVGSSMKIQFDYVSKEAMQQDSVGKFRMVIAKTKS
jgi:phenylacetate-CoA ligase